MLKVLSNILCDLDPQAKVIGQKAGICDGVPATSALVVFSINIFLNMRITNLPASGRNWLNFHDRSWEDVSDQ